MTSAVSKAVYLDMAVFQPQRVPQHWHIMCDAAVQQAGLRQVKPVSTHHTVWHTVNPAHP